MPNLSLFDGKKERKANLPCAPLFHHSAFYCIVSPSSFSIKFFNICATCARVACPWGLTVRRRLGYRSPQPSAGLSRAKPLLSSVSLKCSSLLAETGLLEHNRQLFTNDGIIGSKCTVSIAAHSALTGSPADSLGVPLHLITSYFKVTYELLKSAL